MTPHAGYHYAQFQPPGSFEGWYSRITLAEASFAFMVAIADPGTAAASGMVQVLGPEDQLLWRSIPGEQTWSADAQRLALCHSAPHTAYCLAADHHSGFLTTPQGDRVRWSYAITPRYSFGDHEATMGWLGYLPFINPGWQIVMALGEASGWLEWQDQRFTFANAPAYCEKNWGSSFPERWFWLQANAFAEERDLALTCAGGIRQLAGWPQTVALVSLHWQERHYCFRPGSSRISWDLTAWGGWQVTAVDADLRLEIVAETDQPGQLVLVPTATGQAWQCRDTTVGQLCLRLFERDRCILQATTSQAGLEIGGTERAAWQGQSQ